MSTDRPPAPRPGFARVLLTAATGEGYTNEEWAAFLRQVASKLERFGDPDLRTDIIITTTRVRPN